MVINPRRPRKFGEKRSTQRVFSKDNLNKQKGIKYKWVDN